MVPVVLVDGGGVRSGGAGGARRVRGWRRGVVGGVLPALVAAAVGAGSGVAGAAGAAAAAGGVPEADLAYHGMAVMSGGTMDVGIIPVNHGPSAVADATVRLRWSAPLADRQELPEGCARTGTRVVLCRTGSLPADGVGERTDLRVRLREAPSEVLLELSTVWGGGAVDRNRVNDRQRVLVLDTGDGYHF